MFSDIKAIGKRDLKSIFSTKATFVTILALCIIPCLYTLINVKAIWSPYSDKELQNIKIDVVNFDKVQFIADQKINVGDQVVSNLKENKEIGWRFVSKDQAHTDLRDGTCYAEIVIPQNFSKKMLSFTQGYPQKADLTYIKNTKTSPMTGIITDAATSELASEVKSNFMSQIVQKAFLKLNTFSNKLENKKLSIANIKQQLSFSSENMNLISKLLENSSLIANSSASILKDASVTNQTLNSIQLNQINGFASNLTNNAEGIQSDSNTLMNANTSLLFSINKDITQKSNDILRAYHSYNSSNIRSINYEINEQLDLEQQYINTLTASLGSLNSNNKTIISRINMQKAQLDNLIHQQEKIAKNITARTNSKNNELYRLIKQQINNNDRTNKKINDLINNANTNYGDSINASMKYQIKLIDKIKSQATSALKSLNSDQKSSNKNLQNGLLILSKAAGKLKHSLNFYGNSIKSIGNTIDFTNDSDINSLIKFLKINPIQMGSVVSNPLKLKVENLYHSPNFGSDFAPSYMVISIWVGCAMLISVLSVTVPDNWKKRDYSIKTEYFGKMIIFNILSLIQTLIIVNSTIFILHVRAQDLFILELFGVIVSLVFSTIVYSLASLFGNIGKALAVILAAFQIAASGTIYPIQLEPHLYRLIQPIFPFTYGVSSFRETISGISVGTLLLDFVVLIFFYVVFICVTPILKIHLKRHVSGLHDKFIKSGIGND